MSVPPRWIPCPRKGQIIDGKFLPFKTPLSSRYDGDIPEEDRFNIDMIVTFVEGKQLRMGLVVDLTKTDRFYDKRTLSQHNIGYHKLQCEGFGEAPTQEQVDDFNRIACHFFQQHPMEVIGVHCTHGYNRTGFLIIAYLVEKEDWSLEAAVAVFARARPPGIYKGHYLQQLAARYNAGAMSDIPIPERPDWCLEEEGYAPTENETNGRSQNKTRRKHHEFQNENAKFVEGVSGVSVVGPPKREEIQQQVQYILKWDQSGFAGSQPVSMDVQNIRFLHEKPYRVSWKADGTRYMMYIHCEGAIYMLDRDNSVFIVPQLKFLSRKRKDDHIFETLVDGEMVMDKSPGGSIRPRYLIYDVMQFEKNQEVALCDHKTRLVCATRELIEPREEAAKHGRLDKNSEPFGVRAKQFWDVSHAKWVLESFMKDLTHENDGLIFSPATDPYQPGRCNQLLKWKPSDLNTVDFKLSIGESRGEGRLPEKVAQLFVGGLKEPFSRLNLKIPRNREARQYNGRIIECYWDQKTGWNFMRVREDKSHPNGYTTAKSVCQSIVQPVTKEWLLEVIERHRWTPTAPASMGVAGLKRPHPPTTELMPPPKTMPRPPR